MAPIHKVLNVLLPLLEFIFLLLVLPPYLVFKFFYYIKRCIFSENVGGKVVIITGAASGIGKGIAYEYARRGASLALVDINQEGLDQVVENVKTLGSPDAIAITADVTKLEDCRRFVGDAVNRFGRLDHLVNNAGISRAKLFQRIQNILDLTPILDTNFWGAIYATHFAIPHLRKNKGKIIVIASYAGRFPLPGTSIYNASKAAIISFYETLRCEIGSDIGITIVTPGFINTEMTRNDLFVKGFKASTIMESPEECSKAIVKSSCRGDKYLAEPSWVKCVSPLMLLCPELVEYFTRILFLTRGKNLRRPSNY